MSLFNKKDDFAQESEKADKEVISSIIDQKMSITGELSFSGKTRIDGTVEGNIKGEHLVLSESGKVVGDIFAASLVCHGTVEGNIKANLLTARKSCQIHGRIEANSLTVEPGAGISGEIKVACQELHLSEKDGSSDSVSSQQPAASPAE